MRICPFLLLLTAPLAAAPPPVAKVTQAVNEVTVSTGTRAPRPAEIGETLGPPDVIRTGPGSQVELVFADETVARLGGNTVFRLRDGARDFELGQGSVLLQVPGPAGGATVRTATVTVSITGATSMFEYNPDQRVKLLTLEGTQKLGLNDRRHPVPVPPGRMIVMLPDARSIPQPVTIDLARLLDTSILAGERVFGPLPQAARKAIERTVASQRQAKRDGKLRPARQVLHGPGIRAARSKAEVRQPPSSTTIRRRR